MKKLIFSLVLLTSVVTHSVQGIGIFGEIFFSAATPAILDGTGSGDATTVTFGTQHVDLGLGDYAGIPGGGAIFATFASPFVFGAPGTLGANVVAPLWTLTHAAVTYSFDLATITVNTLAGTQRNLEGLGTAFITGLDPSPALWTMNFSGSTTVVSFSAATHSPPPNVPDSGTTLVLLGIGLLGLAGIARRYRK